MQDLWLSSLQLDESRLSATSETGDELRECEYYGLWLAQSQLFLSFKSLGGLLPMFMSVSLFVAGKFCTDGHGRHFTQVGAWLVSPRLSKTEAETRAILAEARSATVRTVVHISL